MAMHTLFGMSLVSYMLQLSAGQGQLKTFPHLKRVGKCIFESLKSKNFPERGLVGDFPKLLTLVHQFQRLLLGTQYLLQNISKTLVSTGLNTLMLKSVVVKVRKQERKS